MQLLNVAVLALIAVCTHASNGVILNYLDGMKIDICGVFTSGFFFFSQFIPFQPKFKCHDVVFDIAGKKAF